MCNFVRWRRRNARPDEALVVSGNNKVGRVPNVALMPGETCDPLAPCNCAGGCYAFKLVEIGARATWEHNTRLAQADPAAFFASLRQQFAQRSGRVPFFRFFVSGDFPSPAFLTLAMQFMADHPQTRFLVFTKRYRWMAAWLDDNRRPPNVAIVLSAWPGWAMFNPHGLPVAYMQDGTEARVPANAIPCPGNCEGCGMCWSLPDLGRDVVFHKH